MSLARKAVAGALWAISSSIVGRAVGLVGTLLLTHYLAPEAYGEVHIASIVVVFVTSVFSLGFGQYIVANPKAGPEVVFHATFYHIVIGFLGLGALLLLRDQVALLFPRAQGMVVYLPWLVAANCVDRVSYLPSRILARDMRFRALAMRTFSREIIYTVVTLTLAMKGWGAWAVMWGMVVRTVLVETALILYVDWRAWIKPVRLSWKTTQELMTFLPIGAANILHYLARRGDNLLIAGLYGKAAVGQYNLAYNLADVPASHIGEHIGDVLLPSFAQLKTNEDRQRALVRAAGLLSLVVFPLAVGLGAVAHTLVDVIFNEQWADVAPMLVVLSVLSILRPVGWLVQSYLQAMRRARVLLILEVARTVTLLVAILALSSRGVLWACYGVGIAYGINAFASLWIVDRTDGLGMFRLLKPYLPPLLACLPMVLAVLGVRAFLGGELLTGVPLLLGELLAGAVAYVLAALVVARAPAKDAIRLVSDVVRSRLNANKDKRDQEQEANGA